MINREEVYSNKNINLSTGAETNNYFHDPFILMNRLVYKMTSLVQPKKLVIYQQMFEKWLKWLNWFSFDQLIDQLWQLYYIIIIITVL